MDTRRIRLSMTCRVPVARDDKGTFNETALYKAVNGDLVAFMKRRCAMSSKWNFKRERVPK